MCDALKIDNKMIEDKRKELKLPAPTEFENGRISPELIDKLMELLLLPFDESAVETGRDGGFTTKGVSYALQLNRVQKVFGPSHIKIEHRVDEYELVKNERDESKQPMHWFKVYVSLKIGNWTMYTDANNTPGSEFVTYYQVDGIGYAGAVKKGSAEKNAVANGLKDCFKTMGMLRYLYLDEDDSNDKSFGEKVTKVRLLEKVQINDSGTVRLKARAVDVNTGEEIDIIVYRENKRNPGEHQKMLEMLLQYKEHLVKGKELKVGYFESLYQGKKQYVINKVITDK
ncbi:MAG: hypothetical protein H0Z24_03060 [Thermosipho sp. (in: Bacteria)]|nr:hypothetical protein [Thermosipho sp. (in: thermotogales)]